MASRPLTLTIDHEQHNTHREIQLSGHFSEQAYDQFKTRVVDEMEQAPVDVIVDLNGLESIVSSGLGLLTALSKTLADNGRQLILIRPRETVEQLIRTVQLDRVMPIHPDRQSALGALGLSRDD